MSWLDEIDLSLPDEGRDGRGPGRHRPMHRSHRSSFPGRILSLHWIRRAAWVTLALSVAVFLVRGVDRVKRPVVAPDSNATPSKRVPGFDQVAFLVSTDGAGRTTGKRHCALLASTEPQRNKGLMFRRDLAGYDGVIFRWTAPTDTQFWMKDTLIPLSIAWFDQGGHFVSATDMTPCPNNTTCPVYGAKTPYMVAIEVVQGGLTGLGIGPNSSIAIGGTCT